MSPGCPVPEVHRSLREALHSKPRTLGGEDLRMQAGTGWGWGLGGDKGDEVLSGLWDATRDERRLEDNRDLRSVSSPEGARPGRHAAAVTW